MFSYSQCQHVFLCRIIHRSERITASILPGRMHGTSNSLGGSRVQKFHKQQPVEVQKWIPYQVYDFDMNINMISEVVASIFEASAVPITN